MEKVKITKCESIFNGKAHGVTFGDGRQATAWNDKINPGLLMQAYATDQEIEVEVQHYTSKAGKQGLNIVAISQPECEPIPTRPLVKGEEGYETQDAYNKYAKETTLPYAPVCPITESEKIEIGEAIRSNPDGTVSKAFKANLMSPKDIMIISQCLTKCYGYGSQVSPQEVLDAYRFFVLELEQNG